MSNEAKTTKAYKISPELKEKLERLAAESGLETQEAFIEQLAALYELQQLKEGNGSGYRKQIEELEYHLSRPLALFTSMIETEAADRLQLSQQHEEKQAAVAVTIFAQEQEIADLQKGLKSQADEVARLTKENDAQAKLSEQLEAAAHDKGLLVEEYRQRIDTLSGLVNEYKVAANENKDLKTKLSEFATFTEKQAARITALEGALAALEASHVEHQRQAEERHRVELELLSKQKDAERKEALADLRDKQQDKLEQATEEIRKLYAQIEQQRKDYEQQIAKLQQPAQETPPQN
ncbi:hypothetical protein [Paenibacillus ihuae]|uniref:hypothetical protein n=1 Tax=Paenibacillus ihuae TaxID=1232431 RepID=UPI0006D55643|nr:hypothetical protein [Paenibacillus ihuae]